MYDITPIIEADKSYAFCQNGKKNAETVKSLHFL